MRQTQQLLRTKERQRQRQQQQRFWGSYVENIHGTDLLIFVPGVRFFSVLVSPQARLESMDAFSQFPGQFRKASRPKNEQGQQQQR